MTVEYVSGAMSRGARQLIEADLQMMNPGYGAEYTKQLVIAAFGSLDTAASEVEKLGGRLIVGHSTCVVERKA